MYMQAFEMYHTAVIMLNRHEYYVLLDTVIKFFIYSMNLAFEHLITVC
jgi:hypothetical protein